MTMMLVVVHPFEGYDIGDLISDATDVSSIACGEHGNRAVRVFLPTSNDHDIEEN